KTSVARAVLQFAHRARLPVAAASIHKIDAPRWFGAAVEACLFCVTLAEAQPSSWQIPVFSGLEPSDPVSVMGFSQGRLIADSVTYQRWAFADGICPRTWRQGLKHDAAAVMELVRDARTGLLRNRAGAPVEVEAEFVYPLIKGSDLKRPPAERPH